MAQYQPLHADRHRASFNFTLILALGLSGVGLLQQDPIWIVIGLGIAVFTWLTTPNQYLIYNDRLLIAYGRPRVRHLLFHQFDSVEPVSLPFGARLLVLLKGGRRFLIQPRDLEEFQDKLQNALDSYRKSHDEGDPVQEGPYEGERFETEEQPGDEDLDVDDSQQDDDETGEEWRSRGV